MESELIIYDQKPLTAKDVRAQVNLIQEVIKSVFQEGQHYGKIPGCGDKPTLLKPGAEKLITTFNLCPKVIVEDLSKDDIIRYRIICRLETMSGKFVGDGVGECSSEEGKYKWRKTVSNEEYKATPETHKRIKYNKNYSEEQVRTNPYDLANTILKMAKKRALVDATLTRTAASDIFTQDIEDMPEELFNKDKLKGKIEEAEVVGEVSSEGNDQPPPASSLPIITSLIDSVTKRDGVKNDKPYTVYTLHIGDQKITTFSKTLAGTAKEFMTKKESAQIEYKTTKYGMELVSITPVEIKTELEVEN